MLITHVITAIGESICLAKTYASLFANCGNAQWAFPKPQSSCSNTILLFKLSVGHPVGGAQQDIGNAVTEGVV